MNYFIIFLHIISVGSLSLHRHKNPDAIAENTLNGKFLLSLPILISYYFITYLFIKTLNIKWYWSFILTYLLINFFSIKFAYYYSIYLGYKSKPRLSLIEGRYVKSNLYIIDSIITFVLGFLLYIFSIYF
jgi:hypothetical protein